MSCRIILSCVVLYLLRTCGANTPANATTMRTWNPKYLANCSVSSARTRERTLVVNMTGTTLVTYGNNVSIALILQMRSGRNFKLTYKICEVVQVKWLIDFMKKYTNLPNTCPIKPGTYHFYNMELPPKNMPIPVPERDFDVILQIFVTATRELIVDVLTVMHFDRETRTKKGSKP